MTQEERYHWLNMKKRLWKMPLKQLDDLLTELQKDKMLEEMKLRGWTGDPQVPMSIHRKAMSKGDVGNLKELRHKIAYVMYVINTKQEGI